MWPSKYPTIGSQRAYSNCDSQEKANTINKQFGSIYLGCLCLGTSSYDSVAIEEISL